MESEDRVQVVLCVPGSGCVLEGLEVYRAAVVQKERRISRDAPTYSTALLITAADEEISLELHQAAAALLRHSCSSYPASGFNPPPFPLPPAPIPTPELHRGRTARTNGWVGGISDSPLLSFLLLRVQQEESDLYLNP